MHTKYQCSIIDTSEDMSKVKVFVTDSGTDRQMSLKVPRSRERLGTIINTDGAKIIERNFTGFFVIKARKNMSTQAL